MGKLTTSALCDDWKIAVCGVAMITIAGCSQTPREPGESGSPVASATQSLEATPPEGEAASKQAIVVSWEDFAPSVRAAALSVQVRNTVSEPKTVNLELVGIDPRGRVVMRPLGEHSIAALSAMALQIPLADLPSQSVRLPSSITVVAHYQQSQPGLLPGEALMQRSPHASSALRFVTFDPGFQIATIRTEVEQLRVNTAALAVASPEPPAAGELRLYDPARRAVVVEDPATVTESGVVMAVTGRLPPEFANPFAAEEGGKQ